GQEDCRRGDVLRRVDPAAPCAQQNHGRDQDQPSWLPIRLHRGIIGSVNLMATSNSCDSRKPCAAICTLLLCGFALAGVAGQSDVPGTLAGALTASNRVQRLYRESQRRWQQQSNSPEGAWSFGRACFDMADFVTNDTQRSFVAEQGIAACRQAIALQP